MKLGRFASEVYRIIAANENLTAGEVFMIYKTNHPNTIRSRNEVAKRVSDLKAADLVYEDGSSVCQLTNRRAGCLMANTIPDDVTLSHERAESQTPTTTVADFIDALPDEHEACRPCGCGCSCATMNSFGEHGYVECDEEVVEEYQAPYSLENLSREDKAKEISRLMQEEFLTIDKDDEVFLRDCKVAIVRMLSNPLFKTLAPADMKDKAKKLEKALRYF